MVRHLVRSGWRMMRPCALSLVLAVLWFACGSAQTGAAGALQELQGKWRCVSSLKDGKHVDVYVGVEAHMEGEALTWYFRQADGTMKPRSAVFHIDPQQNPKHFDWHYVDKPEEVHRRLYLVAGDILIWSTNLPAAQRPETFTAGGWQFVMKRL